MPRIERINEGGYIYHVLNRANARVQIFDTDADYSAFEEVLEEGSAKFSMRILAYCLMPNHWHLILHPRNTGDLSLFMGWVANTHTHRWHSQKGTIGEGHLYQGRYKSFLCQDDAYFLTLVRYVERNAKKANLVRKAEMWKWSSVWRREFGPENAKKLLSDWPVLVPKNYLLWLNEPQTAHEEELIELSEKRDVPFGSDAWVSTVIKKFKIEQTQRPRGRPKKGG